MLTASGEGGELTRSGRVLATLGMWNLNGDGDGLTITASVKRFDAYHLPRTSCARVTLTIGKSQVKYAVFVSWDGSRLKLTRGGDCGIR